VSPARLALGTAQLGPDYGVANTAGRPSPDEIDRILHTAVELGVEFIDTAAAYGEAETILGRFYREVRQEDQPRIGTKTPRLPAGLSRTDLRKNISAALDASRRRLGVETIDTLLVHGPDDLRLYGAALVEVLAEGVHEGRVKQTGLSVYDARDVRLGLLQRAFTVTQFPFNALARDCVESGAAGELKVSGHETFARSALHQGLLTMTPESAERAVPGAHVWVARFQALCAQYGLAPISTALRYAASLSAADFLVVGVDSAAQLREVAPDIGGALPDGFADDVRSTLADVPQAIADPRQWPRPHDRP
jgi:aryl-alcohol dehydrogenase-like predicted oxidoreductase